MLGKFKGCFKGIGCGSVFLRSRSRVTALELLHLKNSLESSGRLSIFPASSTPTPQT